MNAAVLRDKKTGEFACIIEGVILAKGKSGLMVSRVYDMAEAVNIAISVGDVPQVTTEGRDTERRFGVIWGNAVIANGMNATGAYRILDSLEALYAPAVTVTAGVAAQEMGTTFAGGPDGPSPSLAGFGPDTGDEPSAPVYETDDGKGNSFEDQQ